MYVDRQHILVNGEAGHIKHQVGELLVSACEAASRSAVAAERTRFAGEIHDGLAQAFVAVLLHARAARRCEGHLSPQMLRSLDEIESLAVAGLEDARRCVFGLRAIVVECDGLAKALERLVASISIPGGARCVFVDRMAEKPLPPALEDTVYRIVQEATQNALKHAGASLVTVVLERDDALLRICIDDDGNCVPHDVIQSARERGGLRAMRQRAEDCGGSLALHALVPCGTRIDVALPLIQGAA